MRSSRALALLLVGGAACAPLRPRHEARTPYGSNEGKETPVASPAPEAEYEPPMGWSMVSAEECGVTFAMPGAPKRAEQATADGVHAVYTFEVDVDTRLTVDCAEQPNAAPETVAAIRDGFARIADDAQVEDLGPFEVAGARGHGFQLRVHGAVHRYRVVVIGGRRVQLSVIGAHEYPGLYESLRPLE
jgi:hypothetical protein